MNYKNIFAFLVLLFVQVVVATDGRPSWLKEVIREASDSDDSYHKKVAQSYIKYADDNGIKKTIIVGSGRGKLCHVDNYAVNSYKNHNNYLLVDLDPNKGATPDIKANILKMNPDVFGADQYDYVIFECVDLVYSFTKGAIQEAFTLLKKNGKIVSSAVPTIRSVFDSPQRCFRVDNEICSIAVDLKSFRDKMALAGKKATPEAISKCKEEKTINNLKLCNEYEPELLAFFDLSKKAKIEYKIVDPSGTDEEWPKCTESLLPLKDEVLRAVMTTEFSDKEWRPKRTELPLPLKDGTLCAVMIITKLSD